MLISSVRWLAGGRKIIQHATRKSSNSWQNMQITTKTEGVVLLRKQNFKRAFSTVQTKLPHVGANASMTSEEERREFMATFKVIVDDLTEATQETNVMEVTEWYRRVLQYNASGGKNTWGLSLVNAYKTLEDPDKLTPDRLRLSYIMGWCVQLIHGGFLMIDDFVDQSETRRGKPCWYKNPDVGLCAIYDGICVDQGAYVILRRHFSRMPYYVPILELFHETTMNVVMGQTLDLLSHKVGKSDLSLFTMERFNTIVINKTAYHTFFMPTALAMYMVRKYDPEIHRQIKAVLLEMGRFYQIQDDFLDCFGDNRIMGKNSSDIREGKCSWLIVMALQRVTPEQRKVLEANYGRPEPEAIQSVRNLYEELDLPSIYTSYEEEIYKMIRAQIQQIPDDLPHDMFYKLLDKIFKRSA